MPRPTRFQTTQFLPAALLLAGCLDGELPTGVPHEAPAFAAAAVCTGNIQLASQAQVNAFDCSEVTGNLTIAHTVNGANTDINDLRPLSTLTAVGGTLIVFRNPALTSLAGLENLATVGAALEIVENNALSSISALSSLASIGGRLHLRRNEVLTSLAGLGNLTAVGENVVVESLGVTSLAGLERLASIGTTFAIQFNHSLTSLTGLASLTSFPGWFIIRDNDALESLNGLETLTAVERLDIQENQALTSLVGLGNLATVTDVLIEDNPALVSLAGFESISSVSGAFNISNNPSLTSLAALSGMTAVGSLLISFNEALPALTELQSLTSIGTLRIVGTMLPSLAGLEKITSFPGGLTLSSNAQLASVAALTNVTSVGGHVSISGNPLLASLEGLENVNSIGGALIISSNTMLASLNGLDGLATVGERLEITGNPALPTLEGLDQLATIGGDLTLRDNASLTSLAGLMRLQNVVWGMYIQKNAVLQSLTGVNNLISVGREFIIEENAALTSLAGLSSLSSIGTPGHQFTIRNNPALTSLAGLESLTSLAADLNINDNAGLVSLGGLERLVAAGRDVEVERNTALTSVAALANLTSVVGSVSIRSNPSLASLAGLDRLTSIGGNLAIEDNDALATLAGLNVSPQGGLIIGRNDGITSLAGLEATTAAGFLWIRENAALMSLAGLQNLATVADDIRITDNPMLSTCSCGLAALISSGAFTNVGGPVTIANNAPAGACNSPSEVLASPCAAANRPPVANAGPDQVVECAGPAGASVTFTGAGSTDPDGDALSFSWSIGGTVIASGATPTVSLAHGVHTVALTVNDGRGGADTDEVSITVADTQPPVLTMLGDNPVVLEVGGAYIEAGATANDVCDGDLTDAITRDASDVNTNEPGAYEVVYRVADASGNTAVATRTVEVIAPPAVPVITVGSGPQTLAKADGKYKNVALGQLRLSVSDASDPALSADQVVIVAVWSDEPEIGAGDATRNDIVIAADCRSVKLRAERRNAGNGRVYTLLLEVTNRSGLTGTATHQIFVPVDRSHQAFDDGAVAGHTVTGNCGT